MEDIDSADISPALKPVFHFIRKLTLEPARMTQKDANAVLAAGWDERAYHEMVVLCCRMNFMNRLSEGFGLAPPDPVMMKGRRSAVGRAAPHVVSLGVKKAR